MNLTVAAPTTFTLAVTLAGTGTGTFGTDTSVPVGATPWSVAIGDLNRDGTADLAVVNRNGPSVSILFNLFAGGGPPPNNPPVETVAGPQSVNEQQAVSFWRDGGGSRRAGGLRTITETYLPSGWELRTVNCWPLIEGGYQYRGLFAGNKLIGVSLDPMLGNQTISCIFVNVLTDCG